jgi:hypothetical protein
LGAAHVRSAWLHRLWLPFLLAACACMIAPIVLGQLPIIVNGTQKPRDAAQLPIIVNGTQKPTDAAQLPLIINGRRPTLGAPLEPSAPAKPQSLPAPPQPLPAPPPEPLPPPPESLPPEPLPVAPQEPVPVFEIEVAPPEAPIEPATFGGVIGVGPAPAPVWIGPGEGSYSTPDEALPIFELSPLEPAVHFRRPLAGMPGDPPDDGVLQYLIQRTSATPQMQERAAPEQPAPRQPVAPQTWPGYRFCTADSYRRLASQPPRAPQRPAAPLGSRVVELMIWPLRLLTEPFRD